VERHDFSVVRGNCALVYGSHSESHVHSRVIVLAYKAHGRELSAHASSSIKIATNRPLTVIVDK
jgi:hypothetical protein